MTHSTKVKSAEDIAEVRRLRADGMQLKAIARIRMFSLNTIRKIVRGVDGYEGTAFGRTWGGSEKSAPPVRNELDGTTMHVQSNTVDGYPRLVDGGKRTTVHAYLARRVFALVGLTWPRLAVVHHIDHDRLNFALSNLSVFNDAGSHLAHHKAMEIAMYRYLSERGLLETFYRLHPELRVLTLRAVWPVNYDPTWLTRCDGFTAMDATAGMERTQ